MPNWLFRVIKSIPKSTILSYNFFRVNFKGDQEEFCKILNNEKKNEFCFNFLKLKNFDYSFPLYSSHKSLKYDFLNTKFYLLPNSDHY